MTSPSFNSIFQLSANPEEATRDWDEFTSSYNQHYGTHFTAKEAQHYPGLLKIFGNSRFLSRFLIKHPQLLKSENADIPNTLDELRLYKYQKLLSITMRDLDGANQELIYQEISDLALSILKKVDEQSYAETVDKMGVPLKEDQSPCRYQILALGKLGGRELNYSSDIDMIPFYETDKGSCGDYSLHEFFVRHLQTITRKMMEKTEHGFLYRVDWDLRPEGKAGSLTNSLLALENYYETFGRNWERQALAKAAQGSGSEELAETFLKYITPFIFKKHTDLSTLSDMLEMKKRINQEHVRKLNNIYHVKLGVGGIREIEFIAQSHLMLFGGKNPDLRLKSTLPLLTKLSEHGILAHGDASKLREAYLFLRKLEHRLQLVDEEQTHLLALDDNTLLQNARRMGYEQDNALTLFKNDLKRHTDNVHQLFKEQFGSEIDTPAPLYQTGNTPGKKAQYTATLKAHITEATDYEFLLDSIRYFKSNEMKKIAEMENAAPRRDILGNLSVLAETIAEESMKLSVAMMEERFGKPCFTTDNGKVLPSEITALAMGKFGGREINYESDLDMIFIYSENGHTDGTNSITNAEFFARAIQKYISILSVQTRAGIGYTVDTELRPSGNAGTLVTSLEGFMDYQKKASQIWEKQALLRARPLFGSGTLANLLGGNLRAVLYSKPFDRSIKNEMHRLRMRVEKEIAKENAYTINFKSGLGGIMDIEFIVQYLQMIKGCEYPSFQTTNTFEALEEIKTLGLLSDFKNRHLGESYLFYRTLESKINLSIRRSQHEIKKNAELLSLVAPQMGLDTGKDLWRKINKTKRMVRKIYTKVMDN